MDNLKAFEEDLRNIDKQTKRTQKKLLKSKTDSERVKCERTLIILQDMRNDVLIQINNLKEQKND